MPFTTSHTLIEQIINGEDIGWKSFHDTYRPLIILRAHDRGLAIHEESDLVQDVMICLFKNESLLKFDKSKGRFRDYMKKIIDRRAFDLIRKRDNNTLANLVEGEGIVMSSGDFEKAEEKWNQEWKRLILQQAVEIVRPQVTAKTYDVFRMLIFDELTSEEVAKQLRISLDSVYVAKHRFIKRLQPVIKELERSC